MADWENRLGQESPLSRALRVAMPEDLRNPLLHPEAVNHFALPPQQPRAELRNLPPRPGDYLSPVSEALSPTMGAYGLGNALGDAYVKGREGDYKGMASPLAEILLSMTPVPGMKKGAMPPRVENPIKAYHGSPHDFDKFDLSKIGTGEGAQAYGHGLYFAENENVAQSYKGAGPLQQWSALDPPKVDGKMYEVAIHASPDQFLDWDKPLSQQSEAVRKALADQINDQHARRAEFVRKYPDSDFGEATGQNLAPRTAEELEAIKGSGIPGIRYLDQGSRNATPVNLGKYEAKVARAQDAFAKNPTDANRFAIDDAMQELASMKRQAAETNTSNYVIFDPALIEILRKYGLLGPVAAGATANALMGDKDQQ